MRKSAHLLSTSARDRIANPPEVSQGASGRHYFATNGSAMSEVGSLSRPFAIRATAHPTGLSQKCLARRFQNRNCSVRPASIVWLVGSYHVVAPMVAVLEAPIAQ